MQKLANQPLPKRLAGKADDVDMEALANDPVKMREYMRKRPPPDAQKMFD